MAEELEPPLVNNLDAKSDGAIREEAQLSLQKPKQNIITIKKTSARARNILSFLMPPLTTANCNGKLKRHGADGDYARQLTSSVSIYKRGKNQEKKKGPTAFLVRIMRQLEKISEKSGLNYKLHVSAL